MLDLNGSRSILICLVSQGALSEAEAGASEAAKTRDALSWAEESLEATQQVRGCFPASHLAPSA